MKGLGRVGIFVGALALIGGGSCETSCEPEECPSMEGVPCWKSGSQYDDFSWCDACGLAWSCFRSGSEPTEQSQAWHYVGDNCTCITPDHEFDTAWPGCEWDTGGT